MANEEIVKLDDVIKINQPLEIRLEYDENRYASRVEDIKNGNLIIAMPMKKGEPLIPLSGSKFEANFTSEMGHYKFSAVYKGKDLYPMPVWITSFPEKAKKIQKREFVRIDLIMPATIRFETEDEKFTDPVYARVKDISGGGIRLVLHKALKLGQNIEVGIDLEEEGDFKVLCQIIRIEKPIHDEDIYWVGMKYTELNERMRGKLIKFIFKKQREIIKNRK